MPDRRTRQVSSNEDDRPLAPHGTDPRPVPIANAYWLPGLQILAGEFPGALTDTKARRKIAALLQAGVSSFLDLTAPADGMQPYDGLRQEHARSQSMEVAYRRMPIPDMGVTGIEEMRGILAYIDAELQSGRTVYVHCWGGVGRTGTVVGCQLVERGLTGNRRLKRWPAALPP